MSEHAILIHISVKDTADIASVWYIENGHNAIK
jgi:hypothetical protein